jgi:hypothetical protein
LSCAPAFAHHGKDFLLVETDDMPQPGHVYATASVDSTINDEGGRTTEITPGLLFAIGNRLAVEPHFHVTRTPGEEFHYDSTAIGLRYRLGYFMHSQWRMAVSGEVEKPRDREEHSEGEARLILARTFPKALVAVNLLAGRTLTSGADVNYGVGIGFLTPLSNGSRVGIEVLSQLPVRDGIEIMPAYYTQFGKSGNTGFKIGAGYFHSEERSGATFHMQLTQKF